MTEHHFSLNEDRACLLLSGEDARNFLQGMVTNDVDKVGPATSLYAAFLSAQGRLLHDLFIAEWPDGAQPSALVLDGDAARLDDLKRRLTMYKLRAKVTITDGRDRLTVALMWGSQALDALGLPTTPGATAKFSGGIVFVDPRLAALGARAILPRETAASSLEAAGFRQAPLSVHQRLRLSLGVPEGSRDLLVEKALPMESGFDELNGVDFKKGCYIGQELTARMKYRALIKKRLFPVEIEGPTPAPGDPVMRGQEEVGEFRSAADGIGLALLKLEAIEPTAPEVPPLTAGAAILRPKPPGWLGH